MFARHMKLTQGFWKLVLDASQKPFCESINQAGIIMPNGPYVILKIPKVIIKTLSTTYSFQTPGNHVMVLFIPKEIRAPI